MVLNCNSVSKRAPHTRLNSNLSISTLERLELSFRTYRIVILTRVGWRYLTSFMLIVVHKLDMQRFAILT